MNEPTLDFPEDDAAMRAWADLAWEHPFAPVRARYRELRCLDIYVDAPPHDEGEPRSRGFSQDETP